MIIKKQTILQQMDLIYQSFDVHRDYLKTLDQIVSAL